MFYPALFNAMALINQPLFHFTGERTMNACGHKPHALKGLNLSSEN